jgi:hypothetical protein
VEFTVEQTGGAHVHLHHAVKLKTGDDAYGASAGGVGVAESGTLVEFSVSE